ncbi:hypothetical protein [Cerasicoccus arenae]|uniref:Chorismatase FkbO/Hyg5-like N-terminal domain-containing protein n=1 Tax=Cerasicoccus arenae TaxID=424488 RepID=A0A8J3GC71_9BACT|nr:hypothetical protein [Cerasicoccus arenae]MBK1858884.1 hypothetical protein [Cerasicoccus arenae]GHB96256.1 hypothetical protein GCM10007047_10040 [Cerasicoccus arenae]
MPIRVIFGANHSHLNPDYGEIHLATPLLEGAGQEVICAGSVDVFERSEEHFVSESNGWLVYASSVPVNGPLADCAEDLYHQLFRCLDGSEIVRIWNFVPAINEVVDGLENYRAFCFGRHEAFVAKFGGRAFDSFCAASAVGVNDNQLTVFAMATHRRAHHLENPLQSPAYRYPERYGPRPPSFSRSSYVAGESPALYISGTAAVRGSDSIALGDLAGQLEVTGENLDRIIAESVAALGGDITHVGSAIGRAYVRRPEDASTVMACIREHAWCTADRFNIVHSDICREELLVEIELSWPAALA